MGCLVGRFTNGLRVVGGLFVWTGCLPAVDWMFVWPGGGVTYGFRVVE